MYLEFFNLREMPFSLTPNTEFFFNQESHFEAITLLTLALESEEGFVKIVGEVGTGKTILCRKLIHSLGDRFITAYLPNPFLNPDENDVPNGKTIS